MILALLLLSIIFVKKINKMIFLVNGVSVKEWKQEEEGNTNRYNRSYTHSRLK